MKEKQQIECIAGENVNYVKPDLINKSDLSKEIVFHLRVKNPDRRVQIQFKDETNHVIYKRRKVYVIPSEMVELKLKLDDFEINTDCERLVIEVIPRPEVLIEED